MTKKLEHSLNIAHEAVAMQLQARVLQARIFYRLAIRGYTLMVIALLITVMGRLVWPSPNLSWQNAVQLLIVVCMALAWWNVRRMCKIIEDLYAPHLLQCPIEEAERIAALATPDLLKMTEDNIKIM